MTHSDCYRRWEPLGYQINSPTFMKKEESATRLYFEPDESSPHSHTYFFKTQFNIIFPSTFIKAIGFLSSYFPTKILYACFTSPTLITCFTNLILFRSEHIIIWWRCHNFFTTVSENIGVAVQNFMGTNWLWNIKRLFYEDHYSKCLYPRGILFSRVSYF